MHIWMIWWSLLAWIKFLYHRHREFETLHDQKIVQKLDIRYYKLLRHLKFKSKGHIMVISVNLNWTRTIKYVAKFAIIAVKSGRPKLKYPRPSYPLYSFKFSIIICFASLAETDSPLTYTSKSLGNNMLFRDSLKSLVSFSRYAEVIFKVIIR